MYSYYDMPSIALHDLAELGRYRWTTPVMALLAARGGARFVEMLNGLRLPRESLVRTLEAAIAAGWVVRNPGHGHPLRPEYVLTAEGVRIGEACRAIMAAQDLAGLPPDAMTRWSLPVIRLIAEGNRRFSAIARALESATPRALTASLKGLVGQDMVDRRVLEGFPPASDYGLTPRGTDFAERLLRAAA